MSTIFISPSFCKYLILMGFPLSSQVFLNYSSPLYFSIWLFKSLDITLPISCRILFSKQLVPLSYLKEKNKEAQKTPTQTHQKPKNPTKTEIHFCLLQRPETLAWILHLAGRENVADWHQAQSVLPLWHF